MTRFEDGTAMVTGTPAGPLQPPAATKYAPPPTGYSYPPPIGENSTSADFSTPQVAQPWQNLAEPLPPRVAQHWFNSFEPINSANSASF